MLFKQHKCPLLMVKLTFFLLKFSGCWECFLRQNFCYSQLSVMSSRVYFLRWWYSPDRLLPQEQALQWPFEKLELNLKFTIVQQGPNMFSTPVDLAVFLLNLFSFVSKVSPKKYVSDCDRKLTDHSEVDAVCFSVPVTARIHMSFLRLLTRGCFMNKAQSCWICRKTNQST